MNRFKAYCETCAFKRHGERDRVFRDAVTHFTEYPEHQVFFGHETTFGRLNEENTARGGEKLRKMLGEKAQRELWR